MSEQNHESQELEVSYEQKGDSFTITLTLSASTLALTVGVGDEMSVGSTLLACVPGAMEAVMAQLEEDDRG